MNLINNCFINTICFNPPLEKSIMDDKKRILSAVALSHAFNDASVVIIPLLFPIFKKLFNLSYTEVGIITGGGMFITLIAELMIGRLSDKGNRRTFLILGTFLLGVTFLFIPFAQGFLTLVFFVFMHRFAASFFHPIGIAWISKVFKKDRLDWAMGIQSAFGDFGAFIAILTTPFIVELKNWTYPFYVWTIVSIFCLFVFIYLTHNLIEKNNNETRNKIKKKPFQVYLKEDWKEIKKTTLFLPGYIISGLAWSIIINYLPLLLAERTNLSLSYIGIMISIWVGIGVIVCLFYGKITNKFGRKNVIIISYVTIGLMGISLSIFTDVLILFVVIVFLGIATFLSYPALFSFISEVTDENIEGKMFVYIFTIELE
jgi:FSR family fosmidomycin resistance protein-like MFS transporter